MDICNLNQYGVGVLRWCG